MSTITNEETASSLANNHDKDNRFSLLRQLIHSWEAYVILFVAAFLRLFQFGTTEFDDDEAAVFHMAYTAVHHGYLMATSNIASIHIYNPPAIIYFFMLPALFTNDPIWGAIMVGILMIISVLLTYIFVRQHYGRVPGTIAALLYATLFRAVIYSRFIWNQNLLPLFVVLFMMLVFRGAVARRKGWFAPALFLLGLLIQLHGSGIFMLVPFALAIIIAPETIRRRDMILGVVLALLIYAPYLFWEAKVHLFDIHTLLHPQSQPARIDTLAWHFYEVLLNPYSILSPSNPLHWNVVPFIDDHSLLGQLAPYVGWISWSLPYLVIVSMFILLVVACRQWFSAPVNIERPHSWVLNSIVLYWRKLHDSPTSAGLLLLLSWQFVPLILLIRHSALYLHYFIILLPGPCIILALFFQQIITWLQHNRIRSSVHVLLRFAIYVFATLIILAQFVGSTAGVLDLDQGHYSDGSPVNNLYNDLRSLQTAVNEADQLAQQRHLNRVYISTDWPTQSTLRYLSTFMKTPTTLFSSATQADDHGCVALPDASSGPAVFLVGPYSNLTDTLLHNFASAELIDRPARPGGDPFRLYVVSTHHIAAHAQSKLGDDLQLLNTPAQTVTLKNATYLVTRWQLLRTSAPDYRKIYGYNFAQTTSSPESAGSQCNFTAQRAGDQILVTFRQNTTSQVAHTPQTQVQVSSFEIDPYFLHLGPLTFETYRDIKSPDTLLLTQSKQKSITLSVK